MPGYFSARMTFLPGFGQRVVGSGQPALLQGERWQERISAQSVEQPRLLTADYGVNYGLPLSLDAWSPQWVA